MHEAADSFSSLSTAEMRLWQFSHCRSTFFRSPHCLKSELARKTLIPELVSVSLHGAVILLTKGFGRPCGWRPALGQGNAPGYGSLEEKSAQRDADEVYSDIPLKHPLLTSRAYRVSVDALKPATWSKQIELVSPLHDRPDQTHSINTDFYPR